jgi:hypothetical protein
MRKVLKRATISLLIITLIGKLLLWFPQPAFADKVTYKNFTLYSNNVVKGDIEKIFNSVTEKIKRCEHFDASQQHRIFLCEPGTFYNRLMFTENGSFASSITFRHNILIFQNTNFANNSVARPGSKTAYYLGTACLNISLERIEIK